ncbi:MAG: isochorismatase family cysteine hydrolase [Pseudomonadota bacterium]
MATLSFGPLDAKALHLCIDMQRLFLEPGPWYCPAGLDLLPAIGTLCAHAGKRSLFTRFITPNTPEDTEGTWRRYYRHWRAVTVSEVGVDRLELHPELLRDASPERICDKATHDAFQNAAFASRIAQEAPSALIFSGIETDVCVLATALTAVDLGYRTVIATDAVASSVHEAHAACLQHIYPRFDQQIELATVDGIIAAWPAP